MKPIYDFFVSSKYQKTKDLIFHCFIFAVVGSGLFFFFTGITLPAIIVAILFGAYEVPNTILNAVDVILSYFKKR